VKQIIAVHLLGWVTLASVVAADEPTDADWIDQGKTVAQAAFKELSSQLMQAMTKGGPTNAIEFCSVNALPLTKKVATSNGVQIRRVSHKPRNPANAANEEERAQLNAFAKSIENKKSPAPVIRRDPRGTVVFYAPITINNPLCLNCHGVPAREIRNDTLTLIRKKYPDDKATGFAMNDLRGMWRIEFQVPAKP